MKKTVIMMLAFVLLFAFTVSARPGDDRIIADKNARIADLEKQLLEANDEIVRLERKIERMERKFGKWAERQEPARVKSFNVTILAAKIDKTGTANNRRDVIYSYALQLVNKERFPVRNFKIMFVYKDRRGDTVESYTTDLIEIGRMDKKELRGEFLIDSRMDRRVDKIDAEIIWE